MKRDMNLIRNLLILIEAGYYNSGYLTANCGEPSEEAFYHLRLIVQGGLATRTCSDWAGCIFRLTEGGATFLNLARDERVWRRANELLTELGGATCMSVWKWLLEKVAEELRNTPGSARQRDENDRIGPAAARRPAGGEGAEQKTEGGGQRAEMAPSALEQ